MKPFAYVNPANEKDAVASLSKEYEKSLPIGGGQDLLARLKDYVTQPDRLVNVKNLDATVARVNGGLRIGSAMKMIDVAEHAEIGRLYPAVAAAAIEVGTPQIRNQGTVGGSPIPMTPRSGMSFSRTSICGMSDIPASRYHSMFGLTICPVRRSRMRSSNSAKFSEPMTPPYTWLSAVS